MSAPRMYQKKKRARSEAETRQRIVDAAIAMHQSKGNAATITEIARLADVGRVTLYRHFPDELSLLSACTSHYMKEHPLPEVETWAGIEDPLQRLRKGLADVFAYHRNNVRMMTAAEHAVAENPILAQLLEPMTEYWTTAIDRLAAGLIEGASSPDYIRSTIALAVSLPTWRLLALDQGLSDDACVEMFATIIACQSTTAGS